MLRQWLSLLVFVLVALSGCTSDDESPADEPAMNADEGSDETPIVSANQTVEPTDGNTTATIDTAPTVNFTADVLSGPAPLTVNFTINVTDSEGDSFAWSLDVNGDGEEDAAGNESAGFEYLYNAVNTYNVTLTVTSTNTTQNATLVITVEEGLPEGPCNGEPEPCIIEEHPWVTVWSDGRCDAKGAYGDPYYVHDRPGPEVFIVGTGNPAGGDWPYGTGYITGGGTWIYEESNDLPGLQLNDNVASLNAALGTDGFAIDKGCVNGDTMVI